MKQGAEPWVAKAEGDFGSALREYRARKSRNLDACCFHAQQCVEKYLKAWLTELGRSFPKTHDLIMLLGLCPEHGSLLALREDMALLSASAVAFRYPGEEADRDDAKHAIACCRATREILRDLLDIADLSARCCRKGLDNGG